ncbi:hypothetical protein [Pedococcus dokdonensis]|uniref:hypothetical protein n=1 Tax=Pedococcus dokdonensis TaxID=443156 RepID=UPI000B86E0E5|nr:hypothetical protein [Pedococcus dokdonensis]
MRGTLVRAVGDAGAVIVRAGQLLWRHWPVLTLIYLLGAATHNGLLWFCVWLSEEHATTAAFVLPLVPMATLTALILALRELTPSLAHVRPPAMSRLTLLASTLIPFLTVYVSQQYLKEDTRAFLNAASSDELLERSGTATFNLDRTNIASGAALVGIVAGALLVRWLLDRLDLPQKAVGWGLFAAYVEVLWVWLLAKRLSNFTGEVEAWVRTRRLSHWLLDRWGDLIDVLGPVGRPVEAVGQWLWGAVGQADAIIVVPIAWLTVGAVVYGRKLERRDPRPVATPVARPAAPWQRGLTRVPAPVRRAGQEATANLRGRFSALGNGIRLLAVAGLAPMLLFCLVFLLSRQVEVGVSEVLRWIVGPRDFRDALTLSPYLSVVSRGAYTVVLVVLLGAAIDRILGHLDADEAPVSEPEPAPAQELGTSNSA